LARLTADFFDQDEERGFWHWFVLDGRHDPRPPSWSRLGYGGYER